MKRKKSIESSRNQSKKITSLKRKLKEIKKKIKNFVIWLNAFRRELM
jgi:hypothetical protein